MLDGLILARRLLRLTPRGRGGFRFIEPGDVAPIVESHVRFA
jgi:hypothetical protein